MQNLNGNSVQSIYITSKEFKGASDRTSSIATFHESTRLGDKSQLLLRIKYHTSLRRAKLYCQSIYSALSLQTLQWECLRSITSYADILIRVFGRGGCVLQGFSKKRASLNLIIKPFKTTYISRPRNLLCNPNISGQVTAKTDTFKYLGVIVIALRDIFRNSRFT